MNQYRDCFIRSCGWFENSSAIFITMEYMQLGDLEKYLCQPFPEAQVCNVLQQLLEGLQFMHDNHFAHRDLKPGVRLLLSTVIFASNYCVPECPRPARGPSWWVKIADFGISKRLEEATDMELRTAIGTPCYVAPEVVGVYSVDSTQSVDQAYSFLVDIWSAGAIAFRMLTSQHAFSDRWQLFNYVVHGKPFPSQRLAGFSVSQVCVDSHTASAAVHQFSRKSDLLQPRASSSSVDTDAVFDFRPRFSPKVSTSSHM